MACEIYGMAHYAEVCAMRRMTCAKRETFHIMAPLIVGDELPHSYFRLGSILLVLFGFPKT